ncbi:MAG TPA: lipid-A-disaccharide synthase [Gammaproteobacteria bacterium]|nr:lipid-A-disaccharide synthase [Gammaproteobacteria bacterium]
MQPGQGQQVGILAGEASGDRLGAGLIHALNAHQAFEFTGIGGSGMIAAGCHSLFDMERLSVMGLIEPLRRLPELFRIRRELYHYFIEHRPAVFIGIDSPDFNLGLELKLRRAGIPVIHYVSPSVWAWRQKRIFKIAKATDLVLALFPFEADFYKKYNVPVQFVGHPLADLIPLHTDKMLARKKLNLDPDAVYIALLPGSRQNEINYLAERFLETAAHCYKKRPSLKFITSSINEKRHQEFEAICKARYPDLPLTFFQGRSHEVMEAADVVLVTSGTATLETMLYKRPMVIAYRMANLTFQLGKRWVKLKYIGMPNLLANERLVPEFIQEAATADNMSAALLDYLDHPEKVAVLEKKFLEIHQTLRCNANEQAAKAVLNLLKS